MLTNLTLMPVDYPINDDRHDKQSENQNIADIARALATLGSTRTVIASGNRVRTALPTALFSSRNAYDGENNLHQIVENVNGTNTYNPNRDSFTIAIGTQAGDIIVRSTNEFFHYQAYRETHFGQGVLAPPHQNGQRLRVGAFYDQDGLFFERDIDGIFYVVRRSAAFGIINEERIPQSDWNVDTFDGSKNPVTNPSGIKLDLELIQMLKIGLEWYGAGDAWLGFKVAREVLVGHVFLAGNRLAEPVIGEPTIPLRWELENITDVTTSAGLEIFGGSVSIEGGFDREIGFLFAESRGWDTITIDDVALTRVFTIRPKALFKGKINRVKFIPTAFNANTSRSDALFLIKRDTPITNLATATWQDVDPDSGVEYSLDATGTVGGRLQIPLYASANNQTAGAVRQSIEPRIPLTTLADGTNTSNSAVFAIVRPGAQTSQASAGIRWREVQ